MIEVVLVSFVSLVAFPKWDSAGTYRPPLCNGRGLLRRKRGLSLAKADSRQKGGNKIDESKRTPLCFETVNAF